jgi:carbohydrate kinase (thermoresistant glucokinase family)
MGVAGSGKTTIAKLLADALHCPFLEGDRLHPASNVEKMRLGIALDDADRLPWLKTIAAAIDAWQAQRQSGVVTCSALKRRYRDILIGHRDGVRLVYLRGSKTLIGARLAARQGHFMPAALLDSQFAALEEPGTDERAVVADVGSEPAAILQGLLKQLEKTPK